MHRRKRSLEGRLTLPRAGWSNRLAVRRQLGFSLVRRCFWRLVILHTRTPFDEQNRAGYILSGHPTRTRAFLYGLVLSLVSRTVPPILSTLRSLSAARPVPATSYLSPASIPHLNFSMI